MTLGKRILIVDDTNILAMSLASALKSKGYQTQFTGSGKAALNLLGSGRFDALLTDVRMPEIDGVGLIEEVRKKFKIPIIAMSGYEKDIRLEVFDDLKVSAFLSKPFQLKKLLDILESLLPSPPPTPHSTTKTPSQS